MIQCLSFNKQFFNVEDHAFETLLDPNNLKSLQLQLDLNVFIYIAYESKTFTFQHSLKFRQPDFSLTVNRFLL